MYPISIEVVGDFAMFADPATGSESVSYPFPPPTACIGILDSIKALICDGKRLCPTKIVAVGICNRPTWTRYSYNSYAHCRKGDLKKKNNACQIHEHALESPRFQILAIVGDGNTRAIAHQYQEQLYRRLRRKQSFHHVCLGRKEFVCTGIGPATSPLYRGYSTILPSLVMDIDYRAMTRKLIDYTAVVKTAQNVEIDKGVICFIPDLVEVRDDRLLFVEPFQRIVDILWQKRIRGC
jgi:CRISPR-associated Cas5-like protein